VQPTDIDAINLGQGFHRLGRTVEAGPVTFYMEVVTRQWAQAHRDTLVRYLRAKGDAMAYINDPRNREDVKRTIAEITKYPPAILDQTVAAMFDPNLKILPRRGELDPVAFNNLYQMGKAAGLWDKAWLPVERFYDLSYGREAGIQ